MDKLLSRNVVGTLGQNCLLKMLFKNLIIITLIKSLHTLVACNIRQQLQQQGQHLTKTCKLWAPTWQSTAGWAPEMG